jgi:PAS domain S-box-containing protein
MPSKFTSQVHEAFSRLARRLRALDLPHGLTNERLSTLATIRDNEPISVSTLAEAEIVSLPTMSRMVAKLEVEGLVKRREDKVDGRGVLVSITAKGKLIYQRATQQSLTHLQGTLSTLKPEQLAAIHTLLSSLVGPRLSERSSEVERLYAIAPVGLCYLDTDLRFVYINEWLARLNGLPVKAHLGKTIDEVLEDVAAGVVPRLRHVLQTGEPIIEGTVEVETPAHPGELRHYMHNYYPDKNKDGTVVGISCVVQDITERVALAT